MAVSRWGYNCKKRKAVPWFPVSRKKPREEVPEGLQEEEGRMERSREPVLQALQQSPSVIFSPVAMRALRLGGGPRAYSFPPLVAACEPNDAAGLEQIVADAGSRAREGR